MSRVERKEYQETKIMRTMSPGRGSTQNLAEFDQNLDHLLEDLQSTVSRPGSSLGNREHNKVVTTYESGPRTNSLNRVTNLKSSNPVTEYSSDDSYSYTSPDGTKSVKTFKKETYSYQTKPGNERIRMQNNINQLDSLLDDLQQVKQTSGSYNNVGGDPALHDSNVTKRVVQRELQYGASPSPRSGSRSRTLDRSDREGSVTREIHYSAENQYGDLKTIRTTSPSPSRGDTLSRQTKVTNVHAYPLEVVETTTPDINPEILANLDPTLLPSGNTKVTTTIKTYTYEIPGSGYETDGYPPYSPNMTTSTPSKSFVYNKVENNTLSRNVNYPPPPPPETDTKYIVKEITRNNVVEDYPPYQKPAAPAPGHDRTIIKETVTTRNYQPGYPNKEPVYPRDGTLPGQKTYIYNETTTTRNINDNYPDGRHPGGNYPPGQYPPGQYPPGQYPPNDPSHTTYIIKETHNTHNTTTNRNAPQYPPANNYPPNGPNQTTIIHETNTNTTNNRGYPGPGYPSDAEVFDPKHPPYPQNGKPVNVTYKYSSHTSTTNNVKGGYPPGDESEPLLHPRPFPTDNDHDGPPKKLDELMANIGSPPPNSPYNASFNAHEAEVVQQKKIDTLKQQNEDSQKKEAPAPTKNVTGPPVYYPPGHEMFAHKEESGGGWRAEGAYGRESGKYKYEAESKSKSKSSSGAAVIPVCLPLCCGLPCTII